MRWGIAVSVLALVVVAGCKKPKAGAHCDGASACATGAVALACVGGTYVEAPCSGPARCRASPFSCDFSENADGTVCIDPRKPAPQTCTADGHARIQCKSGKVVRDECDGAKGCSQPPNSEDARKCDRTRRAGAPCGGDADWCSDRDDQWLQCVGGKMQVAAFCRGPTGCHPMLDAIACDTSVGQVGDPCVAGTRSCSVDRHALLRCTDGRLVNEETCAAGKACDNGALACR